ncbi:helix-turn-helix domain-containing protein [Gloeothece verrucosa]|uniref:Uncharacterized protein n=1 Tax=Gloeothece verrucosa (strain PCC 7822) TaxID=497965 RepID=E0UHT3_GLOV7|nr:helix-turn-helix domain-containing protein [Gloeothece verrucosa]ADN13340.1 conserved hypothetical protein [Gloeothece verrucosa PCC 7822]
MEYRGKISKNQRPSQGQYLTSFQRKFLQKSLEDQLPDTYRQRILIMLLADEGKSQSQICQHLNCCPATARHWTLMAQTGRAHQWQEHPLGRPKIVNEQYLQRLKELATNSPQDYGYAFRRWTGYWLSQHLQKEFGIEVHQRHINRLLKQMGLSTRGKLQPQQQEFETSKTAQISIDDLPVNHLSDSSSLWSFNLVKS